MRTHLVRIGNSQGIRIPKGLLEQCHLQKEVELKVRKDGLIIRPSAKRRTGWEEAFSRMARQRDDALLDQKPLPSSAWDEKEWKW